MAFAVSAGHSNLPNGNFVPTIYSQKVIKAFRKTSVADDITNRTFTGEIANYGDTVAIITEPDVTITDYVRGQQLTTEFLDDNAITLVIDQAKKFQFAVDDIEKKHSHVNWIEMATNRAAYKLVDSYDTNILNYITTGVITANQYGNALAAGNLIDVGFDTDEITPMMLMNRLKRMMDVNNVPDDGDRFFVADPYFWEQAGDENSKLMNHDFTSAGENLLRNGRVNEGMIRGFKCYRSNNMVTGAVGGTTYYTALAGHRSAVATASQIAQTEGFRSHNTFADVVRGLHLYGRKILRSEGIYASFFKID